MKWGNIHKLVSLSLAIAVSIGVGYLAWNRVAITDAPVSSGPFERVVPRVASDAREQSRVPGHVVRTLAGLRARQQQLGDRVDVWHQAHADAVFAAVDETLARRGVSVIDTELRRDTQATRESNTTDSLIELRMRLAKLHRRR